MKKISSYILFCCMALVAFQACKKDYIIGGSLHTAKFNGTTYEYLHTNPLFDTLILLIDKTGLKDEVNANNTTFFAPTNYCIFNYVKKVVQARLQLQTGDENLVFNFDQLDFPSLKDSLRAYIFPGHIIRDSLNKDGAMYTAKDGEQRLISLEEDQSNTYVNAGFTDRPKYIYITKIFGARDPVDPDSLAALPESQRDVKDIIQSSGIITNNGVVHVMSNSHTFTFAKQPK
ncbi:fasciclin domain-containing protein [Chitinophaga vietnamensis]|uniref:fasciclin domain-containing protein n=1 Tax=Chitinophaga vietnamensis TaxID=2593957 RepID=UPI0011786E01|nr:fasciclin domain-containing protein [Chitinophaga vietnamensis]